ncbi:hypothetical protein CDD83_1442 [Cordyceps sp. RAO-2017]|nr:hypothetical protein CDD83_1442 [Cordyceps sp. RAO-2017]
MSAPSPVNGGQHRYIRKGGDGEFPLITVLSRHCSSSMRRCISGHWTVDLFRQYIQLIALYTARIHVVLPAPPASNAYAEPYIHVNTSYPITDDSRSRAGALAGQPRESLQPADQFGPRPLIREEATPANDGHGYAVGMRAALRGLGSPATATTKSDADRRELDTIGSAEAGFEDSTTGFETLTVLP